MKAAVQKRRRAAAAAAAPRPARPRAAAFPFPPRAATVLAWTLPLVATIVVHGSALHTYFAADDVTFLSRARGLEPTPWTLARPLSEGVTWHLLFAAFGLNPLPYRLFTFALHLLDTTMVFAIARRLIGSLGAACAAAMLFGVSTIVFTPLHWTSCLVELQASCLMLASFLVYLRARAPAARHAAPEAGAPAARPATTEAGAPATSAPGASTPLLWVSALLGLAAVLSKESVILFPLAFLAADRRSGVFPPRPRSVIPAGIAATAYGLAFALTIRSIKYVGTEAYSMTAAPDFLSGNFATYLRWLVVLLEPIRDLKATMNPDALGIGFAVAIAGVILIVLALRDTRHPEEVGAAWFLTFLLPVVPLAHHTYLYYLYLPWAGVCWMVAAAGERAARRLPAVVPWIAAAALVAFIALEARNVKQRETTMSGPYCADRTMRDSGILKNVVAGLDTLGLPPGTSFVFMNPAPRMHQRLAGTGPIVYSYMPFETVLRGDETMRLFAPHLRSLGVESRVAPDQEGTEIVLFNGDGKIHRIGRGGCAITELGYRLLPLGQWAAADSMFRRARELGDTLPDGTFGLMATSHYLGRDDRMREFCREFLRRWPNESRAAVVDSALAKSLRGAPLTNR